MSPRRVSRPPVLHQLRGQRAGHQLLRGVLGTALRDLRGSPPAGQVHQGPHGPGHRSVLVTALWPAHPRSHLEVPRRRLCLSQRDARSASGSRWAPVTSRCHHGGVTPRFPQAAARRRRGSAPCTALCTSTSRWCSSATRVTRSPAVTASSTRTRTTSEWAPAVINLIKNWFFAANYHLNQLSCSLSLKSSDLGQVR